MKPTAPAKHPAGFSLVVTISMMILLTVIAIGLLSLSSISIKSAGLTAEESRARSNARMALMMAIGELQLATGPDTRITAPATIVDTSYPEALGVWRSWEGSDHEANGRPLAPNYSAKNQPTSSGGRFVGWLVSTAASKGTPSLNDPPDLIKTTADAETVPLLAEGSLSASDKRQIHLIPTALEDGGSIAWWISGENQKARLAQPYEPRNGDIAGVTEMGQSHTITNPGTFGLESLTDDPEPYNPATADTKAARKAVTRQTMALLRDGNPVEPEKKFHDLSSYATGLLTNTATGGWRKDLSILTEKWDNIYNTYPGKQLPLFRFTPTAGSTSKVPKPVKPAASVLVSNTTALTAATPAQSNLYPWSEHSTIIGTVAPNTYHAASASWQALQSYAIAYKNFTSSSGSVTSPFVWDRISTQGSNLGVEKIYNYRHRQLLYPQIARFQFIIYATAIEDPARLNQNPKRYAIRLMYVPFFTLWNPYNVTLQHTISGTLNAFQGSGKERNFLGFGWRRSPPGVMAVVNQATYPNPDLVPPNQYRLLTPGNFQVLDRTGNNVNPYDTGLAANVAKGMTNRWVDKRTFGCWLPEGTLTFGPGEAKIFSPEWDDNQAYGFSGVLRLKEGYTPNGVVGVSFNAASNLLATQNYWFLMRTDRVTQPYIQRQPGSGFSLSFGDGSSHFGAGATMPSGIGDEYHNITSLTNQNDGENYWPPDEVDEVGYSIGALEGVWAPLFSISFGPRLTIGTGPGTKQNRPTKGMVQNNALAAMVLSDTQGDGKDHPANNTFDFAYHSLSLNSTLTPNVSNSKSFIATGYQSGDGLSRLIMCNLPLRPMASLIELEGWNPRGQNPYPPFQMNLIGNSDATPLIPENHVVPQTLEPSGDAYNLMHDDAYCANHLLFDDWFVSSLAPQPYDFGGNTINKDINTVYQDFLSGQDGLANRAYQRIPQDTGLNASQITALTQAILNGSDGWLKVASRFEVEGMFNVNSTSVEAWKALLGHTRSLESIAIHGQNGIIEQQVDTEHIISKGAVASDVKAGSGSGFGAQFANASEYTGYRSLSDAQIDDLATKIVEQVRLRGPFLSLSEFINRQLSNNKDLALAGAVQTAINKLDDDPMAILRNPANSLSDNTMDAGNPKLNGVDYAFAQSADGSSAYGAPGWIRQADILRPIAPILSVRDDTFTIRAYGDTRDEKGKIVARAWCEAVVKRTRDFSDASDAADSIDPPASPVNATFGRRYEVMSFRWLNSNEV